LRQQASLLRDPAKLTAIRLVSVEEVAPAADVSLRAREGLVHVLLNHNDFLTIR
jgi:hypothetical protein